MNKPLGDKEVEKFVYDCAGDITINTSSFDQQVMTTLIEKIDGVIYIARSNIEKAIPTDSVWQIEAKYKIGSIIVNQKTKANQKWTNKEKIFFPNKTTKDERFLKKIKKVIDWIV